MQLPENVILEAVVGSRAYGLDRPSSDEDVMGVYVSPTLDILGLRPLPETINHHDPDITHHEAGKFVRLAMKCNPTIVELLWMDEYRVLTQEAQALLNIRQAFLSNTVRNSYGGYAVSQARKMQKRDGIEDWQRYGKNVRHCFRLLQQGTQLLTTGLMTVRVPNAEGLWALSEQPIDVVVERFEAEFATFRALPSVLPDKPDVETINEALLAIRLAHL